jgi:hypothetical protein
MSNMQNNQARVDLPISQVFQEQLITANRLNQQKFQEWLFVPGMRFGEAEKWWDKQGKRDTLHEGLDICFFRTIDHDIRQIPPETKIPAIYPGTVANICDDFLGKSIFLKHEQYHQTGKIFYTAYGHTTLLPGILPGTKVSGGEIIGSTADTVKNHRTVPSHIHISTAWISDELPVQQINWKIPGQAGTATFFDPLLILTLPYSVSGIGQ